MQEKLESSESSEQAKKTNLKELTARILSMGKQDAMDYILSDDWFKTPRPFQIAIQVRAGAGLSGLLEMYIRASMANLGQIDMAFYQSEKKIADLFGVKASAVHMAARKLKGLGIVRKGSNGQRSREWAIENPQGKPEKEPQAGKGPKPSDPVKKLWPTQSNICDPPSQNTVTDPVKILWPHNNRKDSKKKEKKMKEDKKKEGKPPSILHQSIFKQEDKYRALESLKGLDLHTPVNFCKAYFGLLRTYRRIDLTEKEMDWKVASEILDGKIPRDFRLHPILANWMVWYVLSPPRPEEPPYLTNFKKSWDDYLPTATVLWESITAPERQRREAELKAQLEQEARDYEERMVLQVLQEKQRQEEAKAREEARRQKEAREAEVRKARLAMEAEAHKHQTEEFQNSLPTPETIRKAVDAVPLPAPPYDWLDNHVGYHRFLGALLCSTPVLRIEASCNDRGGLNYPYIARESFDGDHGAFERKTRDFAAAEIEHHVRELKAQGASMSPELMVCWKRYASFFGVPEGAEFKRPKINITPEMEKNPFGLDDEEED